MLFLIHMEPNPGVDLRAVVKVLNQADDWHRLDAWCWVVSSEGGATKWAKSLKKFVHPEGELFVCRVDPSDRNGYKPKRFWNWIKRNE